MVVSGVSVDQLCVNTIRTLSIDGVQAANSGHPGLPLGAAPMAYVLWQRHLKHNPVDPTFADRDRFVLSAGHGSMLIYSLLHLYGYDLSIDDLKKFRQWGSKTPGHPEYHDTPGVEATTGPLGQGVGNAVGMAMAERHLAHRFNRGGADVVDHHTYCLVGDGCLMEGIAAEAASLAGHLGLGKLIMLYDSNDVSLDGPTSLSFREDVMKRHEAYGWQVIRVEDGNTDLDAIDAAIAEAKADTSRPSLIEIKTTIGFGSPAKAGTSDAHGSPLGDDEVAATKKALGWDPDARFLVPDDARAQFGHAAARGADAQRDWEDRFAAWRAANPELAEEWDQAMKQTLPAGWDADLPTFDAGDKLATRKAGGAALNAIAAKVPFLIGGDADLSCSTNTAIKGEASFDGQTGAGRNIHFGVREHAMAAIANGMAYHGGNRPYIATFFVFTDYLRPALRLAALNHLPVIGVFTHDSIGLGEDGPTHQPVEQLMSLRAMPHLRVIRPADANETVAAWKVVMERSDGPSILVLSRQGLPTMDNAAPPVDRGAYVASEASDGSPKVLLIATGSEVSLAMSARDKLEADGVPTRVVSMPCFELFEEQDQSYRESVLPRDVPARVSIEAGSPLGWERYTGAHGRIIGLDRFGASAPGGTNMEKLGFTVEAVVGAALASMEDAAN